MEFKKKDKMDEFDGFCFFKARGNITYGNLISFFHEYSAIKLKWNECIPFDRTPWHF